MTTGSSTPGGANVLSHVPQDDCASALGALARKSETNRDSSTRMVASWVSTRESADRREREGRGLERRGRGSARRIARNGKAVLRAREGRVERVDVGRDEKRAPSSALFAMARDARAGSRSVCADRLRGADARSCAPRALRRRVEARLDRSPFSTRDATPKSCAPSASTRIMPLVPGGGSSANRPSPPEPAIPPRARRFRSARRCERAQRLLAAQHDDGRADVGARDRGRAPAIAAARFVRGGGSRPRPHAARTRTASRPEPRPRT